MATKTTKKPVIKSSQDKIKKVATKASTSSAPNGVKKDKKIDPKLPKKMGRPKGTPDVWTTDRKAEVVAALKKYVETAPYPSIADFCYKHLIRKCRLYEFEEFAFWREMLILKKTAVLEGMGRKLNRDHGSRGNFIALALGQVGFNAAPEVATDDEAIRSRRANFDTLFGVSGGPSAAV